jgi:WD40 repeat protein
MTCQDFCHNDAKTFHSKIEKKLFSYSILAANKHAQQKSTMRVTRSLNQATLAKSDSSIPPRRSRRGAKLEELPQQDTNENDNEEENIEEDEDLQIHFFDGVKYETYQELVNAKRKRNQEVLKGLGLAEGSGLKFSAPPKTARTTASQRGIRSKKQKVEPIRSRKSSRLSGTKSRLVSLDYNVANWNTDNSTIKVVEGEGGEEKEAKEEKKSFFKGRINDGSNLTIDQAIQMNEPKWISDDSLERSLGFQKELRNLENGSKKMNASPRSVITGMSTKDIEGRIQDLSIDNEEWVAKVTPDRIYSVASHPSESKMIACAGDKQGYVGLWDVNSSSENNNGVHLFHVHSRPVCCLNWATSDTMVSASYDGTVRQLNVETGTFQEIFATYDSDSCYEKELGYGLDQGYGYWLQYVTVDPRYKGSNSPSLFLSTSKGTAMHVDLRVSEKRKITFHETLSEKKINSLRYD